MTQNRNYSLSVSQVLAVLISVASIIGFIYSMKGDISENRNNHIIINTEFSHLREINELVVSQLREGISKNGKEYDHLNGRVDAMLSAIKSSSPKRKGEI